MKASVMKAYESFWSINTKFGHIFSLTEKIMDIYKTRIEELLLRKLKLLTWRYLANCLEKSRLELFVSRFLLLTQWVRFLPLMIYKTTQRQVHVSYCITEGGSWPFSMLPKRHVESGFNGNILSKNRVVRTCLSKRSIK